VFCNSTEAEKKASKARNQLHKTIFGVSFPPATSKSFTKGEAILMRVAILGSGIVGQTLASGFLKHGHQVVMGTLNPDKDLNWTGPPAGRPTITTYKEAAQSADLMVLAVKGTASEAVAREIAAPAAGKTVIDATNPIADLPPENGVLRFFTSLDQSLMERLQKLAPAAHWVKAFNSVGNARMINPDFAGTRPTMFICGDNEHAKGEVASILGQFGWEVEDMGGVQAARAIEPLCMLWCIPGFLKNEWTHAFKLLRK
jgi:8-hydroxy-5-deazaflavin:NADPH oxidoreductase